MSNGNLIDTSAVLLALAAPERLSAAVRRALKQGPNRISVLSYWEVAIKSMKGKLEVGDPRVWWADALDQLAATPLIFQPSHVARLADLPPLHSDPFDRALISQAIAERLTFLTTDTAIPRYTLVDFRVIS